MPSFEFYLETGIYMEIYNEINYNAAVTTSVKNIIHVATANEGEQ